MVIFENQWGIKKNNYPEITLILVDLAVFMVRLLCMRLYLTWADSLN